MTAPPPIPGDLLERYFDGLLTPEEAAAFERRLEQDADLRAQVLLQRRIDQILRSRLAPPLAPATPEAGDAAPLYRITRDGAQPAGAPPRSAPLRRRRFALLTAAAAALAACVGGWTLWSSLYRTQTWVARPPADAVPPGEAMEQLYISHVEAGLKPTWVCGSDEQMIAYMIEKFGRPMVVAPAEGVELVGWAPSKQLSSYTGVLLARVGAHPVLVLVDRAEDVDERRAVLPEGSCLHLFERTVEDLKLYELTPAPEPAIIHLFRSPDA